AFSVANSPITGSGTFSVTGAGNSSQVVLGDGTLGPLPTGTVTGTGTTNYLSKFTGSSAIGDSLVFDNGTNVGVGTASPTEKLTVEGRVHVNEGTVNRSVQLRNDGLYISRTADGAYLSRVVGRSNGNQIDLRGQTAINLLISSNLALRVHQSRNIGIGTGSATPGGRLHVRGSGTTSATTSLLVQNSATAERLKLTDNGVLTLAGLYKMDASTGGAGDLRFYHGSGGGWSFNWYTNNIHRVRINDTGLGINTTAPTQKLHVGGNARITGAIYDSNNEPGTSGQVLSSTATGTDWVSLSEIQGVDGTGTANYVAKWSDSDTVTDSLIFDNGTNVGIGTTSPGEKLHIASTTTPTLKIEDTTNNSTIEVAAGNFDSTIDTSGRLFINGSTTLAVSSSAVGVGVSSPTLAKLQVKGSGSTSSSTALLIQNSATTNMLKVDNDGRAYFYESTEPEHLRIIGSKVFGSRSSGASYANSIDFGTNSMDIKARSNISQLINGVSKLIVSENYIKLDENTSIGTGANSSVRLQVKGSGATSSTSSLLIQNSATTELFRVRDDGNVGIGTTSPGRTLDVAGRGRFIDSTSTVDILSSIYVPLLISNTGGYAHARINGFEIGGNTTATNEGYIKTADNSRKLLLDTNGWRFISTNTELMRLTSSGNVGIGTTSPAQKLHINGNFLLENNNEIRQKDSGGTQRTIIELDSSNDLNIGGSYSGALKFIGGGSYTEQMRIHDDGNVGIGTTSPNDKLDIVHTTSNLLGLNYGTNQLRFAVDNRSHIKWAGSSGTFYLSGRGNGLFIGSTSSDASARLHVKGSGTTSSTDALLIENSAGTDLFTVRDDGSVYALGSGAVATNTAFGKEAFKSNTTGSLNVAIGAEALELNTTGQENTAVGFQAMENNLTGSDNTALGFKALENNTANENTAVGHESLQDNTTGTFNTAVGSKSLQNNTGSFNTAFGAYTLNTNTTGTNNVAVGINSLRLNTTGGSNTAVGREASYNNTTGGSNTSIGYQASMNNATGSSNTAIGRDSLRNNTASNNTAVGYSAAKNNTSGVNLTALGVKALQANTTGN
ncbi:MAG: hypothetical protein K0U52_11945, partial [Gammaproteobacteria bacterium]|nr:hypothetical protein [Gammaproteobacteria bacterium]